MVLRMRDLRVGGFLNWVPDKDIPESPLRSEDLRCATRGRQAGQVLGLENRAFCGREKRVYR
jgi:hypothetical protein